MEVGPPGKPSRLQEKQGRGSRELEKLGEQQVVLRETLTKLQESQGDLQGKLEQVAGGRVSSDV